MARKPKTKEKVIERRSLRCDFTPKEVYELSLQLAGENKNHQSLEDEKKAITSQYKAKLDESTARINKLSGMVSDGFELREVDCEVLYHVPEKGKKTYVRMDTNKKSTIETMTPQDWNLFNQPDDDEETTAEVTDTRLLGDGKEN